MLILIIMLMKLLSQTPCFPQQWLMVCSFTSTETRQLANGKETLPSILSCKGSSLA
eukprot:m.309967 g.309967  ORF g.309967 m.309967 type:complete len:56 (+) comp48771_c0_seq1:375-542(+)